MKVENMPQPPSQKDGANAAKLKHLWGWDLYQDMHQHVLYTLIYFVLAGALSVKDLGEIFIFPDISLKSCLPSIGASTCFAMGAL